MAVPGHDQRDFDFAEVMELPIVRVVAGEGHDDATPLAEAYVGDGVMVNSGRFDGTPVSESKKAISGWLADQDLGESRVNYRLHDWCISRQRYWGPPIPIIHCEACGAVPVPESDLPVVLPRVEDFKPDDSGVSPLARVEEWYRIDCRSAEARRVVRRTCRTRSSTAPGTPYATRPRTRTTSLRRGHHATLVTGGLLHRR